MNRYLVVYFNRYDTNQSIQQFFTKSTPIEALIESNKFKGEISQEEVDFITKEYEQVNETFGCISGEEFDHLVYKVN